ncbi:MAG TPA: hypothetical protein VHD32_00700 [Candidatus Didemnitutus sp.]|nr:hypothetical protein [Candidatus Didemnitutus sp.]
MSPTTLRPSWVRQAGWVIGLTVLALAISVLRITPKLVPWHDHPLFFETTKVDSMVAQLHDPSGWDRIRKNDPEFNGIQTIRWRLLPPVFGHALDLSPHAYLTLPWLGLAWLMALVVHYALRAGASSLAAGAGAIVVGTSSAFFCGSCAIGYFDPFYLIALVAFTFSPSPLAALGACLLGPWIDEKFLIMLPACVVARWALFPDWRTWRWALLGIAPYCLLRLIALGSGDDSFSRQFAMQGAMFRNYAPALPEGWWYGFRAGWLLVGAGIGAVVMTVTRPARWFLGLALIAGVGAISFLAWDTTRSIAMLLPFLILGLCKGVDGRVVLAVAVLNLLLPAAYVWCGTPVTVPVTSILFR